MTTSEDDAPLDNVSLDDAGTLSPDDVHDLISSRRRRYVLYCLYLYETPTTVPEVADRITAWDSGRTGEIPPEKRSDVYLSLHHAHLPKLDAAGVVAYHRETERVDLAANAERVRPYLEETATADLEAASAEISLL